MGELKPPVILLGNVRSGTTMMARFFALHPELTVWIEPRTVWRYADPGRPHARFDAADATPRVIRYIRKRFLDYQRRHGGRRIVEKNPTNTPRILYVHKIFPEAKFIYLVRHPLAVVSSAEIKWQGDVPLQRIRKRVNETPKMQLPHYLGRFLSDVVAKKVLRRKYVSVWGVRYPGIQQDLRTMSAEEVIARQWAYCSRQAEEDLAALDPGLVFRFRYEDFVADPVGHFERILGHFDMEITPEMAREIARQTDPDRQQKWRRLSPEILRNVRPIIEGEMARHGYRFPEHGLNLDVPGDGGSGREA